MSPSSPSSVNFVSHLPTKLRLSNLKYLNSLPSPYESSHFYPFPLVCGLTQPSLWALTLSSQTALPGILILRFSGPSPRLFKISNPERCFSLSPQQRTPTHTSPYPLNKAFSSLLSNQALGEQVHMPPLPPHLPPLCTQENIIPAPVSTLTSPHIASTHLPSPPQGQIQWTLLSAPSEPLCSLDAPGHHAAPLGSSLLSPPCPPFAHCLSSPAGCPRQCHPPYGFTYTGTQTINTSACFTAISPSICRPTNYRLTMSTGTSKPSWPKLTPLPSTIPNLSRWHLHPSNQPCFLLSSPPQIFIGPNGRAW